jgi:hypothetical protein
MDVDQEPQGTLGPAGRIADQCEIDRVDEQHAFDDGDPSLADAAAQSLYGRRQQEVSGCEEDQVGERSPQHVRGRERGYEDDHCEGRPERLHVAHALGKRGHLFGGLASSFVSPQHLVYSFPSRARFMSPAWI